MTARVLCERRARCGRSWERLNHIDWRRSPSDVPQDELDDLDQSNRHENSKEANTPLLSGERGRAKDPLQEADLGDEQRQPDAGEDHYVESSVGERVRPEGAPLRI